MCFPASAPNAVGRIVAEDNKAGNTRKLLDILLQHKVLESVVVPVPLQQTQNIQRSSDRFGACGNLIVAKEAFSLGPAGRDAESIQDARKERFA